MFANEHFQSPNIPGKSRPIREIGHAISYVDLWKKIVRRRLITYDFSLVQKFCVVHIRYICGSLKNYRDKQFPYLFCVFFAFFRKILKSWTISLHKHKSVPKLTNISHIKLLRNAVRLLMMRAQRSHHISSSIKRFWSKCKFC